MELTSHGMVKADGCNVMRTESGHWAVSQNGKFIGEVDTLAEVPILIERHRQAVRDRLARVTAEAEARREADYTDLSMRLGEGLGIDPNH